MIAITVLSKEQAQPDRDFPAVWACWLELTDGQDVLYLPATAPVDIVDLATHFQAQADRLWKIAQRKDYIDLSDILPERLLFKVMSKVCREEVNALRMNMGLAEYDEGAWKQKMSDKLSA